MQDSHNKNSIFKYVCAFVLCWSFSVALAGTSKTIDNNLIAAGISDDILIVCSVFFPRARRNATESLTSLLTALLGPDSPLIVIDE